MKLHAALGPFLSLIGASLLATGMAMPLAAQWRLEAWLGDAWSAPTQVTFSQLGQPVISAMASWSARPFAPTWIYASRIAHWSGNSAWAFEYMHHKIYMDNPPPGVDYFHITNGINFLLGERLWQSHGWEYGAGAGPVFVVPVSSVRGQVYDNADGIFESQYDLGGAGIQANIARRLRLLPFIYGSLSLKVTAAHLYLHIVNGHAIANNFALHIQYGLSLQTRKIAEPLRRTMQSHIHAVCKIW